MIIDSAGCTRLLPVPECIVEERVWLRGAEVVSHVNYTQLERVRSSRGLVVDPLGTPDGSRLPWAGYAPLMVGPSRVGGEGSSTVRNAWM